MRKIIFGTLIAIIFVYGVYAMPNADARRAACEAGPDTTWVEADSACVSNQLDTYFQKITTSEEWAKKLIQYYLDHEVTNRQTKLGTWLCDDFVFSHDDMFSYVTCKSRYAADYKFRFGRIYDTDHTGGRIDAICKMLGGTLRDAKNGTGWCRNGGSRVCETKMYFRWSEWDIETWEENETGATVLCAK
ncbi:MAG: hypothetical protein FWC61_02140 [Proteobacteria bacterium]|nr:hypothetical protein [Pseudomonadota bacterium]